MTSKQTQGLTLNGLTIPNFIHMACALGMVVVSLYLTMVYFQVHNPSSTELAGSACNLNAFLNCDAATFSAVSNIYGVPISFIGMLVGIVFLFAGFFPSEKAEASVGFLSIINGLGCLLLLIYSLVVLNSLCPMCSLYYIFSWAILFLHLKYGVSPKKPAIVFSSFWLVVGVASSTGLYFAKKPDTAKLKKFQDSVVANYQKLPFIKFEESELPPSFYVAKSSDAVIDILEFSDFQCPYCQVVSERFSQLKRQFAGKINIRTIFFPLDSECNPELKRKVHPTACLASKVAICMPDYAKAHDLIFENQQKVNARWLGQLIKQEQLESCVNSEKTKNILAKHIAFAVKMKVESTPVAIFNHKKVEGLQSLPTYLAIAHYLEENAKN